MGNKGFLRRQMQLHMLNQVLATAAKEKRGPGKMFTDLFHKMPDASFQEMQLNIKEIFPVDQNFRLNARSARRNSVR